MKIAVISSTVFPCPPKGYSGLEYIAWQCARGLAERGYKVTLIAPEGSSCPGCQVLSCGPAGMDEKRAFSFYATSLTPFDVIIDHSWQKWSVMYKAQGGIQAPVLQVMHAPINTMMQGPPPVEKPCFVCISADQAEHLKALHSLSAKVAYNGIDTTFYKPIEGVKRSRRFLFVGRFSTIKGPDLAIKACRQAGVGLDLIGDTTITGEPEFLQQCLALADGEQIRILGGAPRGNCVYYYSHAHAFIHANQRFREPFGLAPIEAMACGLPVIAWNHGAMRETIPSGEAALQNDCVGCGLVQSFDELVEAINRVKNYDPSPSSREGYRKWAMRFSVEAMVLGYERLCEEAVATGGW